MSFWRGIGLAIGLVLLPVAASAEALDVKTGLWESTMTVETRGAPPVDVSQLPPERRARLEAALKRQAAQGPHKHTSVSRHCLTREELSRQPFKEMGSEIEKDGESCKTTVVSATGKHWQGRIACVGKTAVTSELSIDALSREKVKGEGTSRAGDAARAMSSRFTISARWVAADCGKE